MKERKSNFELMRIISMIMVVTWHLVLHSGIYDTIGVPKLFLEFIILAFAVHINSFVLTSGYFQCDNKFSFNKFFKLFNITWFYKAVIAIIFFFAVPGLISKLELFKEIMPIDARDYWYVNCYLLLYLLSPYLNKLINSLSKKEFKNLLIGGFILFSIIPLITNQKTIFNDGYTIVQFCYMYFLGAYLKRYPIDDNAHLKNYSKRKKQIIFISIYMSSLIVNFLVLNFSQTLVTSGSSFLNEVGNYLINNNRLYSNPLIIIQSLAYFLYFSTLEIKSKKINSISKYTLEVYLIHENYYILQRLYVFLNVNKFLEYSPYTMCILVILYSVLIFIVCICIANIRHLLFKFIDNRKFIIKLKSKLRHESDT